MCPSVSIFEWKVDGLPPIRVSGRPWIEVNDAPAADCFKSYEMVEAKEGPMLPRSNLLNPPAPPGARYKRRSGNLLPVRTIANTMKPKTGI
jgi:hypothetical protein